MSARSCSSLGDAAMMMWTERPQGGKSRADGAEREVGRDGGTAGGGGHVEQTWRSGCNLMQSRRSCFMT